LQCLTFTARALQDESYIYCNAVKGLMPKKLRPAVDLMAFKCRTLKVNGTLGPMILDITRGLTKLHNELHNLYSAPNIISMTKLRKMRWVGHLVCV
jgi:hypothetical protein